MQSLTIADTPGEGPVYPAMFATEPSTVVQMPEMQETASAVSYSSVTRMHNVAQPFPDGLAGRVDRGLEKAYTNPRKTPNLLERIRSSPGKRRGILICCLGSVVLTAILLPILLLVIVPKIAQNNIDGSKLVLLDSAITGATDTSFLLTSKGVVEDAGSIGATITVIDGALDVVWIGEGTNGTEITLAKLTGMPDLVVKGGKADLELSKAEVQIVDVNAMTTFTKFLMTGAEFEWKLSGKAKAKAMGLININGLTMNKVVKLRAFDGLKNVSITAFDLPRNDPSGGIQITTTTLMDNPSSLTVEMGALDFSVSFLNAPVGELAATNVTLNPGANTLQLNGRLQTGSSPAALSALSQMFTSYIAGKPANIVVTGTSVTPPSGSAAWLEQGFVGFPLSVSLVPPTPQNLLTNLALGNMDVAFDRADPSGFTSTVSVASLSADFRSPFTFPLKISQTQQVIDITDDQGDVFATLQAPPAAADGDSIKGTFITSFEGGKMTAVASKSSKFADFLTGLLVGKDVPFPIKAKASAEATTAAGVITIDEVPVVDTPLVKGLNSLAQVSIENVIIKGGTRAGMELDISTVIVNPSQISLSGLGQLRLAMFFNDQNVGTVTLPDNGIQRGRNVMVARGVVSPDPKSPAALAAAKTMISNFLGAKASTVSIRGTSSSTDVAALAPGISQLSIQTQLNGIQPTLVTGTTLSIRLSTIVSQIADVTLNVANPFEGSMTLLTLSSTVTYEGREIGRIENETFSTPFFVPAKGAATSVKVPMNLIISLPAIRALFEAVGGSLEVNIAADMRVRVGDYETSVAYAQNNVRTALGL
ncbi:hypothetical protein BC832DRAFT_191806 [Gaertneriomyces semiglobifer]|nr:hypothetical protein BC832DRAFT_191806 [Gaertneriomyces semiglobifer]